MSRWMCGASMKEREELINLVQPISMVIRIVKLRWYRHVMRTC